MSVWYHDVQMNQHSQEYKRLDIYAVTIKMTEYHHWINRQAYHLF